MARLSFRPASLDDVLYIAAHLRQDDRDELAVIAPGKSPADALVDAMLDSRWCTVADVDGEPAIVYGVAPTHKLGVGAPWLLATDRMAEVEREFVRGCRAEVDLMHQSFTLLTNIVHRKNTLALRWLAWLGFTIMHKHPLGPQGELLPFFKRAAGHV